MKRRIYAKTCSQEFPIDGVRISPTNWIDGQKGQGIVEEKLLSSSDTPISEFTTHHHEFRNETFSIRIGQDDHLTFLSPNPRWVAIQLVDCRKDSPTKKSSVQIEMETSLQRKLIIPRGVAHRICNIGNITTRNEPVFYADFNNPNWNKKADLLLVDRQTSVDNFPTVQINKYKVSRQAMRNIYHLRQSLLDRSKKKCLLRKLRGAKKTSEYLFMEKSQELATHPNDRSTSSEMTFSKCIYESVAKHSWNIIPSDKSCISEVFLVNPNTQEYSVYFRQRIKLTFLNLEGEKIFIESIDLRTSPDGRKKRCIEFTADPRVRLDIEPGVAYRFALPNLAILRAEYDHFVSLNEPRKDIPGIGEEALAMSESLSLAFPRRHPADIPCPPELSLYVAENKIRNLTSVFSNSKK